MATKSGQEPEKAEVIEELLDALDTALDRVKVLYEQYFLGIQKQPPTYLHTDVERKIRDLAQLQIRNTAMRYRFVTLQQKFGSYNSYWRRTLRQIENGTYTRNLFKIGRQAARTGAEVPEEILAAMPKRMRDQVIRDREAAIALARLRERPAHDEPVTPSDHGGEVDDLDPAAFIQESSDLRRNALVPTGPHRIADADFDFDAFFSSVIGEDDAPSLDSVKRAAAAEPAPLHRPAEAPGEPRAAEEPVPGEPGRMAGQARAAPEPSSAEARPPSGASGPEIGSPRADDIRSAATGAAVPVSRPDPAAAPPGRLLGIPVIPPRIPGAGPSQPSPRAAVPVPAPASLAPPRPSIPAPSQATKPLRVVPGAAAAHAPATVETLAGPFPRIPGPPSLGGSRPAPKIPGIPAIPSIPAPIRPGQAATAASVDRPSPPASDPRPPDPESAPRQDRTPLAAEPPASPGRPPQLPSSRRTPPPERVATSEQTPPPRPAAPSPGPEPRQALPAGVSDADVNALYARYVKAKQALGEDAEPGTYGKLLKTINAEAPKIMEQYKSKGVEFSVVVKDNQVIIRAKPKP